MVGLSRTGLRPAPKLSRAHGQFPRRYHFSDLHINSGPRSVCTAHWPFRSHAVKKCWDGLDGGVYYVPPSQSSRLDQKEISLPRSPLRWTNGVLSSGQAAARGIMPHAVFSSTPCSRSRPFCQVSHEQRATPVSPGQHRVLLAREGR